MADYEKIIRSSQFTFLVGEEKVPMTIHAAVLENLSAPLYALISNGSMKESQTGVATLGDVDVKTFAGFCEFAYTNSYQTPTRKDDIEPTRTTRAVPQRISKRIRNYRPGIEKLREDCNKFFYLTPDSDKDFDDYHFRSLQVSFMSRVLGSGKVECKSNHDFLFHAKLYVFSTKYLIEPLRQKCLASLHYNLRIHSLLSGNSHLILDLLEYVYANTGRTEPTGKSLLRDLVIHYVACKLPILSEHKNFSTILESNGEIGLDLAMEMMK